MNLRFIYSVIVLLFIVLTACGGHKAAAVVIVDKDDQYQVMGEVEFVNEGGNFHPNIWKAGNVVIFRVDGDVGGETGKAGKAYVVNDKKKFDELESVDLKKSNAELAARYGVKK